ncbi:TetR/AcrR family transcriptional regulator [Paraburkholderia sartisoli]|uniref:Regulatory protein, tetR family n=1 Tax=Paraburkholderia sartisoli TaxID=83784 RepID=A0A1H4GMA4_9BURK|nr:TetR/AcrR family transcriptional regulator [Paraburkholderia sartisoli]SEB10637.1 regulatory protein, tetR family [Paraburkholderia sartisoli]
METSLASSDNPSTTGARERLLDAAEALIYAGGIHATGVDAIVRQSCTARKSFYTHFGSKDALVAAALERRDERWMNWFTGNTLARGTAPRARLIGMFDVLREWFLSDDFHGCAFLNAAGEIGAADDPIRVVAREHKARLLRFVREVCDDYVASTGPDVITQKKQGRQNKPDDQPDRRTARAARLSRQWLILIDGAIGVALVSGDADAALDARTAAGQLLEADFAVSRPSGRRVSTQRQEKS